MARFREITAGDLLSNEALEELYIEAVVKNWWPNTNQDVLEFGCLAEKALNDDTRGTPGRLFHHLVQHKAGERVTQAQEDRAMARFNSAARERLVDRAEEAASGGPVGASLDGTGRPRIKRRAPEVACGALHSIMTQCAIPQHKSPACQRYYRSQHGRAVLEIQAGSLADPNRPGQIKMCPLPYGSRPRLILPYIHGFALRHGTREILMGKSLRRFMESIGIGVDGRRGREVIAQVEALAAAEITLHEWQDDEVTTRVARLADGVSFWLERDSGKALVWQRTLTLSQAYYDSLQNHQVPVNMGHLLQLTRSPRRMDLYVWLSYRCARIPRGRCVAIRIDELQSVFGTSIRETKEFRRCLREDLKAIAGIHPFKMSLDGDKLILWSSRRPVEKLPK